MQCVRFISRDEMEHDSRTTLGETLDDGRSVAPGENGATSNSYFSGRRVGQKFNLPCALSQIIEYGHAAIEQRPTALSRLDAAGVTIEQTQAHCTLQFRHRSGNGRLGHV